MQNIEIVQSGKLSKYDDLRYVVVNRETGEILDDAQGYGYKSIKKARAGYAYKTRTPEQKEKSLEKWIAVYSWCRKHKEFVKKVEDEMFYRFKDGDGEKVTADDIRRWSKEDGYTDLPFTPGQFLRYWDKYPKRNDKKSFQKRVELYESQGADKSAE